MKARTPWIWLAAMLLSACGGTARRDSQPSLEQYMRYAGAPIQRLSYRNSYSGWQIVDDYKIAMFVGNDAYLLTVLPASSGIVSRFDRVPLDDHNCLIDEIRQVDYRRMQRDNPQQGEGIHEAVQKGG